MALSQKIKYRSAKTKTAEKEKQAFNQKQKLIDINSSGNPQQIDEEGRIIISKKGWIYRYAVLCILSSIAVYVTILAFNLEDPFMIHSSLAPSHHLVQLAVAWFWYRNPSKGKVGNDLVSVIIPAYNQESMIEIVVDKIFQSTYKNIEVIAVNDGSKDKTGKILDELKKRYPRLKVIHKKNAGKRKAVGTGFEASNGKFLVFIDSDSIIDSKAIEEFLKTFNSDPKIGAMTANAKAWNVEKNLLTKFQDVWYDITFNIHKSTESKFHNVTCCSGCMCAYRREAIEWFIQIWCDTERITNDDKELTSLVIAQPSVTPGLLEAFSRKRLEYSSKFDDAEDRVLTAQALLEWKAVFVASAVVYTDVPEKVMNFLKQQIRWKKGYLRANFFVSTFFWKKPPLIAFVFYFELMTTISLPLMIFTVFVYEPFIMNQGWFTLFFIGSQLGMGLVDGYDSKLRNKNSKFWYVKPLMNLLTAFVVSMMIIPAFLKLRKNDWITR